jgi:hypothetical protein
MAAPQMPTPGPPPRSSVAPPPPPPVMPVAGSEQVGVDAKAGAGGLGQSIEGGTAPPESSVAAEEGDSEGDVFVEVAAGPEDGDHDQAAAPAVAPVAQGDWLASVCPYLASDDGTYRTAAPDEGHRCTAQDPPATLPLAFQERYCLTDRHPRCEMYKFAQEVGADGAVPVAQVQAAASRTTAVGGGPGANRRGVLVAAGVGGAAILILVVVLLMGSCSSDPGGGVDPEGSGEPQATGQPQGEPTPTPKPTPTPEPTAEPTEQPEPDPDATPAPSAEAVEDLREIEYEVQEGEKLLKIAETFGVTRRRILRANEGMEEQEPYVAPGVIIIVPVSSEMTEDEIMAVPGYQSFVGA